MPGGTAYQTCSKALPLATAWEQVSIPSSEDHLRII